MPTAVRPRLEPGRVYRTKDLAEWSANPTRLASRLVREGELVRLRHGLFAAPQRSRFGLVPPSDEALLDAFLDGSPWLVTGPPRWNALGLGATAVFATPLVYNTRRSGTFELGGRRFQLSRTRFPETPTPEWFVVDLMSNASRAGVTLEQLTAALKRAVSAGRFAPEKLRQMAEQYATREIQDRVGEALT
jgi:hypothetical protein